MFTNHCSLDAPSENIGVKIGVPMPFVDRCSDCERKACLACGNYGILSRNSENMCKITSYLDVGLSHEILYGKQQGNVSVASVCPC